MPAAPVYTRHMNTAATIAANAAITAANAAIAGAARQPGPANSAGGTAQRGDTAAADLAPTLQRLRDLASSSGAGA